MVFAIHQYESAIGINVSPPSHYWAYILRKPELKKTHEKKYMYPNIHCSTKAMAPHSSTLAWRIPGMVEPGGLPSMGSHRVGHD